MLTWATPRFLRQTTPGNDDKSNLGDSGIGSGDTDKLSRKRNTAAEEHEGARPQGPLPGERDRQVGEKLPRKQACEEIEETPPGAQERLARKRDQRVPVDDQKLPREQSAQIQGGIALPVWSTSPENEETRLGVREILLQRTGGERVPDDNQKLPGKQSAQIQGGISLPVWSTSPENDKTRPGVQEILQRTGGERVPEIGRAHV